MSMFPKPKKIEPIPMKIGGLNFRVITPSMLPGFRVENGPFNYMIMADSVLDNFPKFNPENFRESIDGLFVNIPIMIEFLKTQNTKKALAVLDELERFTKHLDWEKSELSRDYKTSNPNKKQLSLDFDNHMINP